MFDKDKWYAEVLANLNLTPEEVARTAFDYPQACEKCLNSSVKWNDWETAFLTGQLRFPDPTVKRVEVLRGLCHRAHILWQPSTRELTGWQP